MREPEIVSLGEHTYEIKPLNTSAMIKLMAKLTRILGPSAAMLDNPADLVSMANVGRVLADLAERMDEAEVTAVCMVLAEHTMVIDGDKKLRLGGGAGAQWEMHFQGDAVALFRWLGAALRMNFGPLAAWLEEASKAHMGKLTTASSAAAK
jgi:hypothetical protein